MANFDCEWTTEDDSRLLRGIYQHGMGSWETIKMDESLKLGDKILLNGSKTQIKRIQARGEYLLKILKKQMDQKHGVNNIFNTYSFDLLSQAKQRKPRKTKDLKTAITKEIIEENETSGDDKKYKPKIEKQLIKKEDEALVLKKEIKEENDLIIDDKKKEKKIKKEKKESKKNKKTKQSGPMHFTANNEPRALDVLGDLDPSIFNECKEKMRPVKKALKALDRPDQSLTESEQVAHTRQCLVQIGNQINTCLFEYKDSEQIKEWRSNLWYFVSKFTEFDAKKLYKLYKHATKKEEGSTTSSPEKKEDSNILKKYEDKYNLKNLSENSNKEMRAPKRRTEDSEENSNSGNIIKKHVISTSTLGSIGTSSSVTIGAITITPVMTSQNSTLNTNSNDGGSRHNKEQKDIAISKHKDSKRDRDRDRERERDRNHGDRNMDRLSGMKDERVRRDSGGFITGHYSGARDEEHWLSRDRDPRDARFGDHKRDRFDPYSRMSGGYHRDRDRDRDRMHINEKRGAGDYYRYSSGAAGYGYSGSGNYAGSSGGAGSGSGYSADISSSHFRGTGGSRNYAGDGYQADWRPNKDYRRDYDRPRPPPSTNS